MTNRNTSDASVNDSRHGDDAPLHLAADADRTLCGRDHNARGRRSRGVRLARRAGPAVGCKACAAIAARRTN